ncbi:MAG: extensin family protein [Paracoccaceae bacterium]
MRAAWTLILAGLFLGLSLAEAGAPLTSIRPRPRILADRGSADAVALAIAESVAKQQAEANALASTVPVFVSPRPVIRPIRLNTRPGRTTGARSQPIRMARTAPTAITSPGTVCGDRKIRGERLAPIRGKLAGCRMDHPVRVTSIDGVTFSQQPIVDCKTATSLARWMRRALKPAIRRRGGGVKSLSVPSHYACRTRNSRKGAKLSEHARGHAIDISAINLRNGERITILDGWKNARDRRLLKTLHKGACGPFGTVLGPEANRYHRDHFHFDTARYRGGPYCE